MTQLSNQIRDVYVRPLLLPTVTSVLSVCSHKRW